jgi:hypothetical protein
LGSPPHLCRSHPLLLLFPLGRRLSEGPPVRSRDEKASAPMMLPTWLGPYLFFGLSRERRRSAKLAPYPILLTC